MPGLVERMQHFVFPVSAANLKPSVGLSLRVDFDAPFRLMGVVIWNLGVVAGTGAEGQIAIRFARPDGRMIQRQLTASNQLFPGNQYNYTGYSPNKALACPIRPGVLYPAGSIIDMDVMGLATGISDPTGVIVVFVGTNIYQEGNVWAPSYPQKWTARPYLDNLTVQNLAIPGGLPSLNNPFTAQADSDFVWQAGLYTDSSVPSSPAIFTNEEGPAIEVYGLNGASGQVRLTTPGPPTTPNLPLQVTVAPGNIISVQYATNAGGFITSTLVQVVNAINAAAGSIVLAVRVPPNDVVPDSPATMNFGPGDSVTVAQLIDLGVIIRDPAYKAYSNDYVPAALLFPFLSAQAPGWLYPELYIPRLTQIYFDFNYLYSPFTPAASPVTITLAMKGMKVYQQ